MSKSIQMTDWKSALGSRSSRGWLGRLRAPKALEVRVSPLDPMTCTLQGEDLGHEAQVTVRDALTGRPVRLRIPAPVWLILQRTLTQYRGHVELRERRKGGDAGVRI